MPPSVHSADTVDGLDQQDHEELVDSHEPKLHSDTNAPEPQEQDEEDEDCSNQPDSENPSAAAGCMNMIWHASATRKKNGSRRVEGFEIARSYPF
jgi:hypothetical protein